LTAGFDRDLCSRYSLVYLETFACAYYQRPLKRIFDVIHSLGLGDDHFNLAYVFHFGVDKGPVHIYLPGRPLFVNYHRGGEMKACQEFIEAIGMEVSTTKCK